MNKGQSLPKIDEFAFVLLAGIVLIVVIMVSFSTIVPEIAPVVNPTSISVQIPKGTTRDLIVSVEGNLSSVDLEASGEIKDWINFNKNSFALFKSTDVTVKIQVPSYIQEKSYSGLITVGSSGGNKTIPVLIDVVAPTLKDLSKAVNLGDFSVSYILGSDVLAQKDDVQVSKGYFSESQVTLNHNPLNDEKLSQVTNGFIILVVDDTNSAGNLIVELNGKEVYSKQISPQEIRIDLDKSQIQKFNALTLRATDPGWKFWLNTIYKIKTVKFGINFQGISSKEVSFDLDDKDVANFKFGKISMNSQELTKNFGILLIKINGQTIFRGTPSIPLFSMNFGNEVSLQSGANTISFSMETDGGYKIKDATLFIVRIF